MTYLLFGAYHDGEGGAWDFHGAYLSEDEARATGLRFYADGDCRLDSWMHLATFDGVTMRVIAVLSIPNTEQRRSDVFEWAQP